MNKFLVGCLITVVVLIVGGGTAGYFLIIKPAGQFLSEVVEIAETFETLNEQIEDQSEYQPESGATLEQAQFERFLTAHRDMKSQLQGRLEALKAKYEALETAEDEDLEIDDLASAYQDLGDLIVEAKRVQVQTLNKHGFSLGEYTWVRDRVYRAIGASVAVMDPSSMSDYREAVGEVPEETTAMVEPHRQELMETHVLAWFGL